jgi:hypothetical protein
MRPLGMIPEMNSIRQNGNLGRTVRLLKAVALIDVCSLIDVIDVFGGMMQVSALAEFQPLQAAASAGSTAI